MTKTAKKTIFRIVSAILSLVAFGAGGYVLYKFEYFKAIGALDNVIGLLPVALVLIFAGAITALLFMHHTKRRIPIAVALALFCALSVVLYPNALRGNWWLNLTISSEAESKPDLSVYAPFSEGSKTAKLDGESTLTLIGNLPVLDGATALYPIYAAFAESAYNKTAYTQDKALCTNTRGAYESIIAGKRDIVFVAGPSENQLSAAKAAGAELVFTPIGREAFVFLVGKNNPVNSISHQQIRNVYSGKTAYWSTLGWREGGKIIAFQRPEGSGSQTGLKNVMGKLPIQVAQPLPSASLIGENSLLKQISVAFKGVQPALGFSYRYYATTMYANPEAKLLQVNGVAPTSENIQNGSYPFVSDFYAVTNGAAKGNAKLLLDWILSPQGQELIEKTGYTPIR